MKGIYAAVSANYSYLNKTTYSKPSMLAISHALEDIIVKFGLAADLFVSFQKFEFFQFEKDRYVELGKICRRIFIFAQGIDRSQTAEFANTTFVELEAASPLAGEWSVIINHPVHPVILTTAEQYESRTFCEDDFRYFRGFLSFDPQVVAAAAREVKSNLATAGIDYQPLDILGGPRNEAELAVNRKIALFVNQLLDKVEIKVTELLNKNIELHGVLNENQRISLEMVRRLCYAAEYRDFDAIGHLARISNYAALLYGMVEKDARKIENMRYASLMHDIGKIGIPDAILLKPGKLTAAEFAIIQTHPTIGSQILRESPLELIRMGYDIALCHHEKWDGSGYPGGMKGEGIPLAARIVAIVDVFDALTSKRVYKEAFPVEQALGIVRQERDHHFDGALADLFLDNIDRFLEIRRQINGAAP